MKIDHLAGTQLPIQRGTGGISFAGDGDFASKLTLGQIIKGRVLRSYEGNRHLVDFGGQQKIVDSTIPLRPEEVIVGRVVALAERVELQRINASTASAAAGASTAVGAGGAAAGAGGATLPVGDSLGAVLERLQLQADPAAVDLVQRTAQRATQPATMAKAGLALSRLGLPLTAEALRLVYDALERDPATPMFALPGEGIRLATISQGPAADAAQAAAPVAKQLGPVLAQVLNDVPEARGARIAGDGKGARRGDASDRDRSGGEDDPPADLARLILNVQSGGAIAHRVGTLPLVVDGRLHEINIALFEQTSPADGDRAGLQGNAPRGSPAVRHRQVVFAVRSELLGTIEVRASAAGTNMRVDIGADSAAASRELARHARALTASLESLGWRVDELAYRTTRGSGLVGHTVLEHLVAPGSVSTLA